MSADGNWKITMNTPMGARTMDVAIATNGDAFAGKIDSEMGTQELTGKVDGDTLTWSTDITNPSPRTTKSTVKSNATKLPGNCRLGASAMADFAANGP